jgi:endonuclease/exonuclease/phosphatase family metal-dependent hydrolase
VLGVLRVVSQALCLFGDARGRGAVQFAPQLDDEKGTLMSRTRGTITRLAGTVAAAVLAAVGLTTPASAIETNGNPAYVVVWNNNIENLADCGTSRWSRLLDYMKTRANSPDIFTVQQVSNQAQLNSLLSRLSAELPGVYRGKIAIADPQSIAGYDNPDYLDPTKCAYRKRFQTNAVIWREGRFDAVDSTTWRSDAQAYYTSGPCQNLLYGRYGGYQDRVQNVAVRLRDKESGNYVNVASVHWPTGQQGGPECADENRREAEAALSVADGLGSADLRIIAGDTNTEAATKSWWQNAKNNGYRDPMAEACGARDCSSSWDTSGSRRIDFLLARHASKFTTVDTVSTGEAGGEYSDHLALRSYVYY